MSNTAISFTQSGGDYVCALADYGSKMSGVVHLALSEPNQVVSVEAGASGMPPMVVETLSTPYGLGLVFEIDFPDGVGVTLRTSKPVTEGAWIA